MIGHRGPPCQRPPRSGVSERLSAEPRFYISPHLLQLLHKDSVDCVFSVKCMAENLGSHEVFFVLYTGCSCRTNSSFWRNAACIASPQSGEMHPIPDPLNISEELRTTVRGKEVHDGDVHAGERFLLHSGQEGRVYWCFVRQQNWTSCIRLSTSSATELSR